MASGSYSPLPHCPDPALVWIRQSIDCKMIEQATDKVDAIHLAAEVGRLDIVSLVLALLAILLGFSALIGYWAIRSAAIAASREEASMIAKKVAEQEAVPEARRATIEWLQSQGIDWSRVIPRSGDGQPDGGQQLADAFGEENGNVPGDGK